MKTNHNEIKEGFLDLVRAELSVYGADPLKISIDQDDYVYIDDHIVDQPVFIEKSNWIETKMKIRCYTVDYGRIIFMPEHQFYNEYRQREDLENILYTQIDEINAKIKEMHSLYISQLAEENMDKTLAERIVPSLAKNYQITEHLSDVLNWKVKIILGNSMRAPLKKGDYDNVGYVRIGLKTGTIVPIACSDEHNRGGDLIFHLINKNLIPDDIYYPICPRNDYVAADDTQALLAFKVWRKLGGPNIVIKNSSLTHESQISFQITIDDYIKRDGKIELAKGELLPLGKELIDRLKIVSKLCIDSRHDERRAKRFFLEAIKTYTFILEKIYVFSTDADKQILQDLMKAESLGGDAGIKKVEEIIFGMNGVKNKIHNKIRKSLDELKKDKPFSYIVEDAQKIFGDLELANNELASL